MADITPIVSLNGEISPTASLTGDLAMPEKVWMQGPPGPQGPKGDTGAAATVTVGTVTTGEPGTDAIVTNSGTENAAVLNFTIPKGETGAVGAVGPQGPKGDKGDTGPAGAGVPDGGTVGQLLGKTETGTAWIDPPQSGVQPDWNQNDSTALDYVKNRPFYEAEQIVTVENVSDALIEGFPIFAVGDTVTVIVDGVEHSLVAYDDGGYVTIGDSYSNFENGDGQLGWQFSVDKGVVLFYATEAHTVGYFIEEVVKVNEKYLPDTVATKSDVEVTQEVLDGVFSSVATFTFDKQTSGKDRFVFNGFNYYKISDFNPSPSDVISCKGTTEAGDEYSGINTGNNCAQYGSVFIIVAAAGFCSLSVTETVTKSFTAPSAGLYARYEVDNPNFTARTGEFTLRASTGRFPITGLLLKSSTTDSAKKFRITVDDTGTLKATEVT